MAKIHESLTGWADRPGLVLFGGTFDPVHHGHLIAARAVAEARSLERVLLVPAGAAPHKESSSASGAQRAEMLRLATADDPLFEVWAGELDRQGPSYTIDTVRQLRAERPGVRIRLIVGGDMLADLPNWHRAGELLEQVEVLVAARPPWDERWDEIFGDIESQMGADVAGRLREGLTETPRVEVSSTQIRRRVAEGRSIRYLVPDHVARYIAAEGLYGRSS